MEQSIVTQAKTLAPAEIDRLLAHVDRRKYAARNRAMVLLTHWAGLRIGEVAFLHWSDVLTSEGQIKNEVRHDHGAASATDRS